MHVVPVADPGDPALRDYRDLTDVVLRRLSEPAEGLYLAESVKVIERAENVPDSLKAYALEQIRHAVLHGEGPTRCGNGLQPGTIGTSEVRLLRKTKAEAHP